MSAAAAEESQIAGIDRMIFREKEKEHSGSEKSPSNPEGLFGAVIFGIVRIFAGRLRGEYGGYRALWLGLRRRTFSGCLT